MSPVFGFILFLLIAILIFWSTRMILMTMEAGMLLILERQQKAHPAPTPE